MQKLLSPSVEDFTHCSMCELRVIFSYRFIKSFFGVGQLAVNSSAHDGFYGMVRATPFAMYLGAFLWVVNVGYHTCMDHIIHVRCWWRVIFCGAWKADPPNIPKTPNLRRYDWKTRVRVFLVRLLYRFIILEPHCLSDLVRFLQKKNHRKHLERSFGFHKVVFPYDRYKWGLYITPISS